ncbi:MAG: hypothetical protein KDD10_17265 [Phaeodactylibacter sp.]|nr:hypothetical protein [Phaeodactylibacter sp.]MCB9294504.1 hypothetical protein [Lewinellaceae bacterium]
MKKYKLYELFETLSNGELRRLRRFLQSPYFTTRQDVFAAFDYLAERRGTGRPMPDRELLFQHIFPGEAYDDQKIRSAMSSLAELIERFWLVEGLDESSHSSQLALAKACRRRGLGRQFRRAMKKAGRHLEHSPLRDPGHYDKLLAYQTEWLEYQSASRRTADLHLQEITDTLDISYLLSKLRYACTQLTHTAVYQQEYRFGILPLALEEARRLGYLDIPAVAIYYNCYRFLSEGYSLPPFRRFRSLLLEHGPLFSLAGQKALYLLAVNFCIRKMNSGSMEFAREGWALYQQALEQGVLLEDGRLSRFTFYNIAATGIRLGELEAVERFILDYKDFLPEEYRAASVRFIRARLAFNRGELPAVADLLEQADLQDLVNNLIAKNLLIKAYYGLEKHELLEAQLESLRAFIQRKDFSDYHRRNYLGIIRFVQRLMALAPYDKEGRQQLEQDILNAPVLTEREWLLEQVRRV